MLTCPHCNLWMFIPKRDLPDLVEGMSRYLYERYGRA